MNTLIPPALHQYVLSQRDDYLNKANAYFNKAYPLPVITYRKKGSVAGSAFLGRWEIQLNTLMLAQYQHTFIQEVIPHELAHLIAFKQFGNKISPHGKEWQWLMTMVFNCTPKRTHNFTVPTTNTHARFTYSCLCQDHALSTVRHNRIQHQQTTYFCKKCRGPLVANKKECTSL